MNRYEIYSKRLVWSGAFLLTALMAGCGGGGDGGGGAPGGGGGGTPPPVDPVGSVCTASTDCVNLATAGTYVLLGQAGTVNTGTSAVTGNIGTSPAASTATTGFAETLDASSTFATSSQVTGKMYASDYTGGTTAADLTQAVADSIAAYLDAQNRIPSDTNPATDIGGLTIGPGVHRYSGVSISAPVTLTGTATDVFIFQVNGTLSQAASTQVVLAGGALAKNVFWQVGNGTTIGANATFEGIIITGNAVSVGNAATVNGRIYAAQAVTLDTTTLKRPQ